MNVFQPVLFFDMSPESVGFGYSLLVLARVSGFEVAFCLIRSRSSPPKVKFNFVDCKHNFTSTYDHRSVRTGHPVRSAIHKH
jgi:hypothetical protein